MKIMSVVLASLMLFTTCAPTISGPNSIPFIFPDVQINNGYGDSDDIAVLQLDDEVNGLTVIKLMSQIEQANADGKKAILIEINTPGGSVMDGMLLAKAMERSRAPVSCVVDGMAASMGYYLLQSCSTRMMTRRSILMIHGPGISIGRFQGDHSKYANIAELLKALEEALISHMVYKMKISSEEMRAKIKNGAEWWMAWQEADKVRAVDFCVHDLGEALEIIKLDLAIGSK